MTAIADAYVELHISGDKIEGEIRRTLKEAEPGAKKEAEKSGNNIGASMGKGFLRGFAAQSRDSDKISRGIGTRIARGLRDGFSDGRLFAATFSKAIRGSDDALRTLTPSARTAARAVRTLGKDFKIAASSLGGLKIPAIAGLAVLATSGISALSGALTAFVGAVVQAGGATLSFVGILGSLIQAKIVAGIAFKDFTKAVAGDEEALKKMSPAARSAAKAAGDLGGAWSKVRKAVQQEVFAGLDKVITRVGKVTLPALQKGLTGTGRVMNDVLKRFGAWVTSEGFVKRFGTAVKGNNKILGVLGQAAVPLLKGILNVFIALQPAALRLAKKIRESARAFREWSAAPGTVKSIKEFMDRAWKSAGNLWKIIKNLGATLRNVFGAATPAGDGLLKTFANLTKRLADFTELSSTKNAIADWAQKGIEVSGTLFKGLGKGFMLIKGLFDPAILGGFMSVFQALMPTITAVVKTMQTALKPVLDAVIGGFAENGPKFAKLFGALAPLVKGVGSVIGEVISQSLDLLGNIAAIITPVVAAISGWLGPVLTKFAPIIATIILAFGGFGATLVKFVPIIGKFLAPLVRMAQYIFKILGPAIKYAGKIFGVVFKGIAKVVGGSMKLVSKFVVGYFKIVFGVIKLYLRVIFAIVKFVWKGISTVIGGVVKFLYTNIKFFFQLYFRVITTVLKAIRAIVTRVFGAIKGVITRVLGAIRGVVTRVWGAVKSITARVWNGIKSNVVNVVTALRRQIINGFDKIVEFVKKAPDRILTATTAFLNAGKDLGKAVINGLWEGLKATGGFIADLATSIKNTINDALNLPIEINFDKALRGMPDIHIHATLLPALAKGARNFSGGMALVGERGPEIVNVPRGSDVYSNRESRQMANGPAPSKTVNQNINIEQIVRGRTSSLRELNWMLRYGTGIKHLQEG